MGRQIKNMFDQIIFTYIKHVRFSELVLFSVFPDK